MRQLLPLPAGEGRGEGERFQRADVFSGRQGCLTLRQRRSESGLTLVEILVASTLLIFITLGLMAMFSQTQRAFRGGVKQVDNLEAGRAAFDMISRDFTLLSDAGLPIVTNLGIQHAIGLDLVQNQNDNVTPLRTNRVYDVFTLTYQKSDWIGLGYTVTNNSAGVGSLHRFELALTNWSRDIADNILHETFTNQIRFQRYHSNFHRVIDGVVHFQVNVLDAKGQILNRPDMNPPQASISFPFQATNHLPSALELELGILEPQTVEQARGMPQSAALEFLRKRADKVHIFRQQIPIRTARQ